jgi:hypothetical protein
MAIENLTLAPYYSGTRNPFNYQKVEQISRDISTEWLTLDEITQQLNLFQDESQDSYLSSLEIATRMAIEDYLGISMYSTQYRVYYGDPGLNGTAIYLDLPETGVATQGGGVEIDSVQYYTGDNNAVLQTLASSNYYYDPSGNRVVITAGIPSPLAQNIANPVRVTYTVSDSLLTAYPVIKQAGLLLFTHLYNNRSNSTTEKIREIPFGVATLLRPYKPLVM